MDGRSLFRGQRPTGECYAGTGNVGRSRRDRHRRRGLFLGSCRSLSRVVEEEEARAGKLAGPFLLAVPKRATAKAKRYEPQFDDALHAEWYRLYDIPRPDRGRPRHFKYLTVNRIYFPLAKSSGRILELLRANKSSGGDRTNKLFQFLNEIGTIALSRHLGRVQEIAEDSADKWEYEARIAKRFGFEQQLELPVPAASSGTERGRQLRRPYFNDPGKASFAGIVMSS